MKRKQFLNLCAGLASGMAFASPRAFAQQRYPQRLVRIVVPYAAGGNLGATARLFALHLSEELSQPFVIDNRPGANGTLGINPALYKNMTFDSEKDLTHVSIVSSGPMVLQVTPSLLAKTVQELLDLTKSQPGKFNFGSGGNGTLAHLSLEMLRLRTGADIVHVPYKGTLLAMNDFLAGHLHGIFDTLSTAAPLHPARQGPSIGCHVRVALGSVPERAHHLRSGSPRLRRRNVGGPGGFRGHSARDCDALADRHCQDRGPSRRSAVAGGGRQRGCGEHVRAVQETLPRERASWAEVVKVSGARAD